MLVQFATRRRKILFWVSILIPASVLVILGWTLYHQQVTIVEHQLNSRVADAAEAEAVVRDTRFRFWVLTCAVVLALSVTLWCRYLVWQDYRRDAMLARMRSDFVASVSHELRTPLAGIQMSAETLALGRVLDPDRQRQYLDTIAGEAARLARLVDNVLEYSRLDRGAAVYSMRPTDLSAITERALAALERPLTDLGFQVVLNLERDGSASARPLSANADAVEQAVLNLVSNAMKYSDGAREIHATISESPWESRIEVADRGIGIPAEHRERIFERFYRVPQAPHAVAGVGLGLTVVRGIMEQHGGRVELRDNQPSGSVFSLIFPAGLAS